MWHALSVLTLIACTPSFVFMVLWYAFAYYDFWKSNKLLKQAVARLWFLFLLSLLTYMCHNNLGVLVSNNIAVHMLYAQIAMIVVVIGRVDLSDM